MNNIINNESGVSQEVLNLMEQEKVNSILKDVSTGKIPFKRLDFCKSAADSTIESKLISDLENSMLRIGQIVPIEVTIDNLLSDEPIVTVPNGYKRLLAIVNLHKAGKLWFEPKIVLHSPKSNPDNDFDVTIAEYYAATNYVRSQDSLMVRALFGAHELFDDIEALGKKNQSNRQKDGKKIDTCKDVGRMVGTNPHVIRYCRTMLNTTTWFHDFIAGDNITASEAKMFHYLSEEHRLDLSNFLLDIYNAGEKEKAKLAEEKAKQAILKAKQAELDSKTGVDDFSDDNEEPFDDENVDYTVAIKTKSYFTIAYNKLQEKIKADATAKEAELQAERAAAKLQKEQEAARNTLDSVNCGPCNPDTIVEEIEPKAESEISAKANELSKKANVEKEEDYILESNLPIPDQVKAVIIHTFESQLNRKVHFYVKTSMEVAA